MSDDGLHHCGLAARLSPHDFAQAVNFSVRGSVPLYGRAFCGSRRMGAAVELRPHFGSAWRTLAASAGKASNFEVATRALSETKRLHPSLSVDWVEKYHPIVHAKDRLIYIGGLRIAGLE